jgi:hypothetical protein
MFPPEAVSGVLFTPLEELYVLKTIGLQERLRNLQILPYMYFRAIAR